MTEMYALAALALMMFGAMGGVLVLFAVSINKEERGRTIHLPNPGKGALGLRVILGARVHPRAERDLAFHGARSGQRR